MRCISANICAFCEPLLHVIYHLCASEKSAVYFIVLIITIQHASAMYFCVFQRFLRAFYCMSSIICVHLSNLRFISSFQSEQSSTPVRCISANICAFCEPLLHVIYHLCASVKSAVYFIISIRTIQHASAMYFCEYQRFLRAFIAYHLSSVHICVICGLFHHFNQNNPARQCDVFLRISALSASLYS